MYGSSYRTLHERNAEEENSQKQEKKSLQRISMVHLVVFKNGVVVSGLLGTFQIIPCVCVLVQPT